MEKVIPNNPYIVGNPIKAREMFFGRHDDFEFVKKKIGSGKTNQIIVLCGDRRSGKTSILFQILSGRLGDEFLPILVDMQILADIGDDRDFFRIILNQACAAIDDPEITFEKIQEKAAGNDIQLLFKLFFDSVDKKHKNKIVLFLFDEYELIEAKIKKGQLSESLIHFLAGILESSHNVSFVFTGSTNLENRDVPFWKMLLGKSLYRKISYLSQNDCSRLITEPLKNYITYDDEVTDMIFRLTGGQPFYTQVICQNLVDLLIEENRNDPSVSDVKQIVRDIVNNPLPQMIYSWNNLDSQPMLGISALSSILKNRDDWKPGTEVFRFLKKSKIVLNFKKENINVILEEAYHKEFLEKDDLENYRFRMDLFRQWIKKEHSIWKVIKETGLKLKSPVKMLFTALAITAPAVFGIVIFLMYVVFPPAPQLPENGIPVPAEQQENSGDQVSGENGQVKAIENVILKANRGPFRVIIDDTWNFTSEGLSDTKQVTVPSIDPGEHKFIFHNPQTEEKIELTAEISELNRIIEIEFKKKPAAASAAPTAAQQEEKAVLGSVFVNTTPAGAAIFLNDQDTGLVSPDIITGIKAGEHTVTVRLDGYKNGKIYLRIEDDKTIREDIALEMSYGQIVFDVRPAADIYFDGKFLIETPYIKPVKVQAGKHRITINNEMLKVNKTIDVDIEEGGEIEIREILE